MSFIGQLERSSKNVVKHLLNLVKSDARSITGSNLKKIKLLTNKRNLIDCKNALKDIPFEPIPETEAWRIPIIKELTDVKFGQSTLGGFTESEIKDLINFVCTS